LAWALAGRDVPDGAEQAMVVEPVDPAQGELLVRQRTMLINAIRAHCAEFGLIAAQGVGRVGDLLKRALQVGGATLPDLAKAAMALMAEQLESLESQIQALNRRLLAWHKQDKTSQRLATIPGVGVISATALAASAAA